MTKAKYTIGEPKKPKIKHDKGFLGRFAKRAPTKSEKNEYLKWYAVLEAAEAAQGIPFVSKSNLPDGLAAYRHFLEGSGRKRRFSFERYVRHDASGRTALKNIIKDASEGAIQLFKANLMEPRLPVDFQMTGTALRADYRTQRFPYPVTENWQKALGAYDFWVSADVHVEKNTSGKIHFTMEMILHVEDMYNFNPDENDNATGIPDKENGQFSITGLAKPYINYATLTRYIEWSGLHIGSSAMIKKEPSQRQRKPKSNRRLRNNL